MQNSKMEGSDVFYQDVDRHLIKEFKLYFNLLINSFNNNDLNSECDYMGRLTSLIHKLEAYKKLPHGLKEMVDRVKYIQNHIENIQEMQEIDPEIKKVQESLDKMG
ncbi:MAG: hypothetical protein K9M07_04845 [Simkaniaceae bacterium]|nr:hypothetical protein [Simkaniaceae bacterium]MCF7852549.1 hypothetical protein [Simkaniaceae bacterium]